MARKKEEPDNTLANYSEVIKRMGDESIARDNKNLEEAKARYPEEVEKMKALPDDKLIESFQAWSRSGFADPRMTAVIQDLAEESKAELLRRLAR